MSRHLGFNLVRNSGSTARDHLANERTFLAWARTGLGFLTAGTGLFTFYHQFDSDSDRRRRPPQPSPPRAAVRALNESAATAPINEKHAKEQSHVSARVTEHFASLAPNRILPACALLWANGAGLLGFSTYRYFTVQDSLIKGKFLVAKGGLTSMILATAVSTVGAVYVVYEYERDTFFGRQKDDMHSRK